MYITYLFLVPLSEKYLNGFQTSLRLLDWQKGVCEYLHLFSLIKTETNFL